MNFLTLLVFIMFFIIIILVIVLFAVISALKQLQETVKTQNKLFVLRFELLENMQALIVQTIKTLHQ